MKNSMKNQAGHKQKLGRLSDQDIWLKAYSGHFDTATVGRLELQNKNIAFLPKIIQTFTNLKLLNLSQNDITNSEIIKISNIYLPNLEILDLSKNSKLSNLENLWVAEENSGFIKKEENFENNFEKYYFKPLTLTQLIISDTNIDTLPCLTEKNINNNPWISENENLEIFSNLEKLEILNTPLNNKLALGDLNATRILQLQKLQWLNHESIFSAKHPNDNENSFYHLSRKIQYHIENSISFTENSLETEKTPKKSHFRHDSDIEIDTLTISDSEKPEKDDKINDKSSDPKTTSTFSVKLDLKMDPKISSKFDTYIAELAEKMLELEKIVGKSYVEDQSMG